MAEEKLAIHVIPYQDPVNYYYSGSKMISRNQLLITDLYHMVNEVCRISREQKKKVSLLTITGHGTPNGFYIGNDWITKAILDAWYNWQPKKLRELIPVLDPGGLVVLRSCDVGESPLLLQAVSTTLGGIPVRGSEWKQFAFIPGLVGPQIECHMYMCDPVK